LECCRQLWDIKTGEPTAECQTFAEAAIAATPHPKSLIKKGILCHLSPRANFFGELDTRTGTDDYPANGISTQLANAVDYILAAVLPEALPGLVGILILSRYKYRDRLFLIGCRH